MNRKGSPYVPLMVFLTGLLVASCGSEGTPSVPSPAPASQTPAAMATATHTPSPTTTPTETPVPPTRTPSPSPSATPTPVVLEGEPVDLHFIDMANSSMGWAFAMGDSGVDRVLSTIDGGQTWQDVSPPETAPEDPTQTKSALGYFPNSSTAWIVYQTNPSFFVPETLTVWRTTDRGLNWTPSSVALPPDAEFHELSDLHFSNPRNGWLIAHIGVGMNHDYFTMYSTRDSGNDWQLVVDPFITPDIQGCIKTALQFVNASTGWLTIDCQGVLAGAFIYQTIDGGISWEMVQLPPPDEDASLFTRAFCGTYTPMLSGPQAGTLSLKCVPSEDFNAQENYLYRTDDGGLSWQIIPVPDGDLLMLDDQVGWALSSEIYQTVDGGKSWNLMSTVSWEGQFSFISRLAGWAVAQEGDQTALVKTNDGGASWQLLEPERVR